ncbi:MAG: recombinase family protein [Cellulosilyticaceae bacterium]
MLRYAIYSRKSRFTGKGDSTQNQIQLCQNYIKQKESTPEVTFLIYEDEGFSGSHTERPAFTRLMADAKAHRFDALICYRIDRISRNVADFSRLIQLLEQHSIHFISISELFDTSTPMGRTMLYIISAFAQLERETTAERIRDNMLLLAKTGRWLGGITPTGFRSVECRYIDPQGKERCFYQLESIPEEVTIVQLIFQYFLETRSLTQLESRMMNLGITTKNHKPFSRVSLRGILANPVYATADETMSNYLADNNYTIHCNLELFDGIHGLMVYNKTLQKKHSAHLTKSAQDWVVAVGSHEGIISSAAWIETQHILSLNSQHGYARGKGDLGLVSGLLRCSHCGSYMRPKSGRIGKDGTKRFYYVCESKEKSHSTSCQVSNAQGNEADSAILKALSTLSYSSQQVGHALDTHHFLTQHLAPSDLLIQQIKKCENQIKNLLSALAQNNPTNIKALLLEELGVLDEKKKTLLADYEAFTHSLKQELPSEIWITSLLSNLQQMIFTLPVTTQRQLIKPLIDVIYWDGSNLKLYLTETEQIKGLADLC